MENNIEINLMPNELYWEAIFSSFFKLKKLSDSFIELKYKLTKENHPISKIFQDYFKRNRNISECPTDLKKILISKNKPDLITEPQKLFSFLIEELHNELKNLNNKINNEEENIRIKSEYDENIARNNFNEYKKNNKSIIQKLFFGEKEITKICQKCKNTSYKIDFLKFCPINIKSVNGPVQIEDLYDNIQREFYQELLCKNCNKKQNFKIRIVIVSEPEIFIFFIFNHTGDVNIDFSKKFNISNISYKLRSVVMGTDKISSCLCNLFCPNNNNDNNKNFISYGIEKGNFYIFEDSNIKNINQKELLKGNPYVMFYEKEKNKKLKNDSSEINISKNDPGSNDYFIIKEDVKRNENKIKNSEKKKLNNFGKSYNPNITNNKNNKNYINNIISYNTEDINTIKNNSTNINLKYIKNACLISTNEIIQNKKINMSISTSNNSNMTEGENLIRLYFKFNDGNIIFIDVNNDITFENIINELKIEYEWINIDENNLYFNEKQINKNQIPKKIGIGQGDYIDVYSNLIDD